MAKTTCGESRRLSIFWFKKEGYLCGWRSGNIQWSSNGEPRGNIDITFDISAPSPHARLQYTSTGQDGEKHKMDYRVELNTTPCHLGGKRYWFICPLVKNGFPCEKRAGILYGYKQWFGCRSCLDLAYASQQENHSSSFFGVYGGLLRLERNLGEQQEKIRVKYWRGRPTKRYARWLKRAGKLNDIDALDMDRQMNALLGRRG